MGKGSTFHFTVRFDHASAVAAAPIEGLEKHFTGLRVLVVDDNPTSRMILHEYLTHAGILRSCVPMPSPLSRRSFGPGAGRTPSISLSPNVTCARKTALL